MPTTPLSTLLDDILAQLSLSAPPDFSTKILAYLDLLDRWNRAYNLTAIVDPYDRMVKHIADSLAVAPYLTEGTHWLDVGSGAGLPGIPLALIFPDRQWTLLDSNAKKTRFLVQVKAVLALDNVEVVHSSVESFRPAQLFDGVICRAWTQLQDMIAKTQHLYPSNLKELGRRQHDETPEHSGSYPTKGENSAVRMSSRVENTPRTSKAMGMPHSYLWAMKGAYPSEELAVISSPYIIYPLKVPHLNEQRHLIRIDMGSSHMESL